MASAPEESRNAAGSLRRVLRLVLATLSSRTELLLVELQEERHRLLEALLLAVALIIAGTLALLMVSLAIVAILWEHRVAALVVLSLLYVGAAVGVFLQLRRRLRSWEAFSGTLNEFEKDREWLKDQI